MFVRHPFPETSQIGVVSRSKWSGSRRPKIHPVIDGQKVISHRARQRVILHGGGGSRVGDSQGVAVTGACNDHSPLPPRHRDFLAATSKATPDRRGRCRCRPERTFTGNATCALCVEKMWEACVCVYNAFGSAGMWGSGALFVRAFSSPISFNRKSVDVMTIVLLT